MLIQESVLLMLMHFYYHNISYRDFQFCFGNKYFSFFDFDTIHTKWIDNFKFSPNQTLRSKRISYEFIVVYEFIHFLQIESSMLLSMLHFDVVYNLFIISFCYSTIFMWEYGIMSLTRTINIDLLYSLILMLRKQPTKVEETLSTSIHI